MEILSGITSALAPENLLYAFIGSFLGTLVGVLPGLGPPSAVALLFPFTAYLPPTGMIITLAAIYYGAQYGGSITAILMNVPGEVSSVVTALDGYAMTKQGRAGPALAVSAIVSFVGGIIGAFLVAVLGVTVARLALDFGPAEYLGLGLFSLTCVASVSGKSVLKGVIVCVVGMLLVSVGINQASNIPRMTFGNYSLYLGFNIVPVMVGLFGVSEVLRSFGEQTGKMSTYQVGKLMPSAQEMRASMGAGLRATAISFPLGMLPGMGPSICGFIAYGVERQRSEHPERFGKGAIEGVAAAEAANNSAAMAHFVPLFSLGIPTSSTMALILAALMVYGVQPGPLMFTQHASLTWTVIGSFFVANFIMLILNLPLVGMWARIATVPYPILLPFILSVCLVGSYSVRTSIFDVWVCVAFGLFGWLMGRAKWPTAPLVLAYVLGPVIELSARQVLEISPGLLLQRPVFWGFVVMGALAILFSRRMK